MGVSGDHPWSGHALGGRWWRAGLIGSGLSLLLATPSLSQSTDRPPLVEDFGRWDRAARWCELMIQAPGEASWSRFSCHHARLDQQLAGLLSLRLLRERSGKGMTTAQVVFAGVLQTGSQPMRCREGSCAPRWPLLLQVNAVAGNGSGSFGVPLARIAEGSCRLERYRAFCEARDRDGRQWQARLRW
jgi:hypothetical protein